MKTLKKLIILTATAGAVLTGTLALTTPAYAGTSNIKGATVFSDSTVHASSQQPSTVQLRAGSSVKQIAAGGQDTAG